LGYRVNYAAADSFSRAAAISLGPAPAGAAPAGSGGSPAISANLVDNCHAGHSHDAPTHSGGLMSRVGDRSSDPRAAKIAAFDFWRARSHHTDFDHDASPTAVRAAFESAWDDLAAEPPGALVA
jgi:hypothetical protein